MPNLDAYEEKLLLGWEDAFKKGQLTFLVLLALKDGPKHMAAIKGFILDKTNSLFEVDDKSMYRALRRFNEADLIEHTLTASERGPDRKLYQLTDSGLKVLNAFIERNFLPVFFTSAMQQLVLRGVPKLPR